MSWATSSWFDDPYSGYGGNGGYGGGYGMMPWQYQDMMRAQDSYNPLGGLLKSGAAAKYNLNGVNLKPMQDIATQIAGLGRAQYDMNDPLYQRTYEGERGQGMMDLAAAISEAGRQNRKLSSMGRTPLFSPERGGETIFRTMTRGYQDVQSQARQRAREILGAGQQAAGRTFDAYGTLTTAKDQNQKKKAFGIGNIGDALPLLGKLF